MSASSTCKWFGSFAGPRWKERNKSRVVFLYHITVISSLSHPSLFLNKSVLNNYPLKIVIIAVKGETELLSEKLKELGRDFIARLPTEYHKFSSFSYSPIITG